MSGSGDFAPSTTVYGKFTTFRPSTGASYTLAGTPSLAVYKDASDTQSTTGVSMTADFDSVTGLNHFAIDTSADGTFYSAGSQFQVVIAAGTVDSVSVVGAVVGAFSINATAALRPTTAGRSLDVSSGGGAGVDWANVESPTTTLDLSGTTISTSQVAASVTGAVGSVTGAVGSVTGNVGGNVTGTVSGVTPATAAQVAAVLTTQITEAYRSNGAAPTLAQFMSEVLAHLGEVSISGTTKTINQFDHSTPAETYTLDDATAPSAITRAT